MKRKGIIVEGKKERKNDEKSFVLRLTFFEVTFSTFSENTFFYFLICENGGKKVSILLFLNIWRNFPFSFLTSKKTIIGPAAATLSNGL